VIAPLLATLCVVFAANSVRAEPFTYYTTGTFLTSGTNVLNIGGSSITYTGQGSLAVPAGSPASPEGSLGTPSNIGLGDLFLEDLNGGGANADVYLGQLFRIDIFQVTPSAGGSPGGGALLGTFTGAFFSPPNSVDVEITLSGFVVAPSATPGQVVLYTPKPNPETLDLRVGTHTTIEGRAQTVGAESVPMPTAGWAGLTLFGLVGAIRFKTRARNAA